MNPLSIVAIAFAMSTDAFAAAIAKGAALQRPSWREALRTGAIFGVIEAITPVVGWLIGSAAAKYASAWDHWIAFTLLAGLGARMIWVGFRSDAERGRRAAAKPFVLGPGADRSRDEHRCPRGRRRPGVRRRPHRLGRRRHRPGDLRDGHGRRHAGPRPRRHRRQACGNPRRPASHRHRHRDRLRAPRRGSLAAGRGCLTARRSRRRAGFSRSRAAPISRQSPSLTSPWRAHSSSSA